MTFDQWFNENVPTEVSASKDKLLKFVKDAFYFGIEIGIDLAADYEADESEIWDNRR